MSDGTVLPEVAEGDATGETARLYGEIRAAMGVPMVALFFRNLAGIDGALEWMWAVVTPALADGRLERAAAYVADSAMPPPVAPLETDDAARGPVRDIVAAYNRANPFNLTCAKVLGVVLGAPQEGGEAAVLPEDQLPRAPAALPAMCALDALTDDLRQRLAMLETADTSGDGIVPSLYRHLGHWPAFLARAAEALAPRFADGSLQVAAHAVAGRAAIAAASIPAGGSSPPPSGLLKNKDAVLVSVDRFSRRIPEMIVVGRLLSQALDAGNPRS